MNITTETVCVSLTDTAKLIRRDLRAAFPGQKFSVRSSSYSLGCSIDVRWEDGPTEREVKAVVDGYAGAYFNGMIDMKEYRDAVEVDGVLTRYGVDYVQTHRSISAEWEAELKAEIEQAIGEPLDFGKAYEAVIVGAELGHPRPVRSTNAREWGSDLFHRLAYARRNDNKEEATR